MRLLVFVGQFDDFNARNWRDIGLDLHGKRRFACDLSDFTHRCSWRPAFCTTKLCVILIKAEAQSNSRSGCGIYLSLGKRIKNGLAGILFSPHTDEPAGAPGVAPDGRIKPSTR